MPLELDNKVAIVTGAGSGIGRETTMVLALKGASVVVADINLESAAATAEGIQATSRKSLAIKADITQEAQVRSLVEDAISNYGRVDIMINNAGANSYVSVEEMTKTEWDRMMDLHAWGAFLGCRFASEHMKKQGSGRIVNVSSLNAKAGGTVSGVNYTAAKAATLGVTKAFAKLLAPYSITVNAVCPGPVDTPFHSRTTTEQKSSMAKSIPLGRLGKPEEIAGAIAFLSSDIASFITGASLDVNGGLYFG